MACWSGPVLTYAEGCTYPPVPVCVNVGAMRLLGLKQLKISSLRNVMAGQEIAAAGQVDGEKGREDSGHEAFLGPC